MTETKIERRKRTPLNRAKVKSNDAISAETKLEWDNLIMEFNAKNKAMNKLKGEADKARKALFVAMEEQNISTHTLDLDGVTIKANVSTPTRDLIDVEKVQKFLSYDKFVDIASVTKKSMEKVASEDVIKKCITVVDGTRNVFIK